MKKLWIHVDDHIKKCDEKMSKSDNRVDGLEFSLGMANDKLASMQKDNTKLRDDLLYVQSQSMRNNLIFANIPEDPQESQLQTEGKVRLFMVEKLKLSQDLVDEIKFDRVHRMGHIQAGFTRKIVAKFTNFKDREAVKRQKKELMGSNFYLFETISSGNRRAQEDIGSTAEGGAASRQIGVAELHLYDTHYINGQAVRDGQG